MQTVTETGVVENQYDYDIFGNPILTIETEYKNAIRYAGEFYDEETGLYYLRARYYNPYTGRFISEDSYWGEDTNPLSLNRYTYAHNNPIKYVDPTGHAVEYSGYSIVDYLNSSGGNASYSNRKGLAAEHGIQGYRGTAQQNLKLLDLLRNQEKQPEPKPKIVSTPASSSTSSNTSGHSIVDYLNSSGEDSSFANRKELAKEQGITNYKGTANQNLALLSNLSGKSTPEPDKNTAVTVIVSEQDEKEQPTYYLNSGNTQNNAQSNATSSSSDNLIYGVDESSYNKMPAHVQDSIESSYKFRLFEDTSWNYVGFDVQEAGRVLGRAQPRSINQLEEMRELPQYKALMNAVMNRGIFLEDDDLELLKDFDPHGVQDYLENSNALSPEHREIMEVAQQYNIEDVNEWSSDDLFGWKILNDDIFEFKDQWVRGYKDVIKKAAGKYDLPEYLVAGISYAEVGGDPLWVDDLAYAKRSLIENGKSADITSFGNVSMQVRVAA